MAWRADTRTPRILATALERLADLAKDSDENDPAEDISGTQAEGTSSKPRPSRQEILESGQEVNKRFKLYLDRAPLFPWLNCK